jgi:hypothetical protein
MKGIGGAGARKAKSLFVQGNPDMPSKMCDAVRKFSKSVQRMELSGFAVAKSQKGRQMPRMQPLQYGPGIELS